MEKRVCTINVQEEEKCGCICEGYITKATPIIDDVSRYFVDFYRL